ncbi:MAG: hypothetical protein K0R54_170 [Clostridiaceae bacterium]|jgi:uncharacterized protein YbaP (TraB family)|nr:hypothetical protein [Clostridiaceae bacterium]
MTVKEANKKIETLDDTIKNISQFLTLSDEEQEKLADKLGLNQSIIQIVNIVINTAVAYKNNLKEKIENAVID